MKRNIIALLIFLFGLNAYTQNVNKVIFDELAEKDIIIGYLNKEGLTKEPFNDWFALEYDNYIVNNKMLDQINPELFELIEIVAVLGTWCHDSQREVPRFLKIFDYLDLAEGQIVMIGVDKNKTAEKIPISRMEIELVPTFIFYYDGEEIGRIIESPKTTLEEDINKILSKI